MTHRRARLARRSATAPQPVPVTVAEHEPVACLERSHADGVRPLPGPNRFGILHAPGEADSVLGRAVARLL